MAPSAAAETPFRYGSRSALGMTVDSAIGHALAPTISAPEVAAAELVRRWGGSASNVLFDPTVSAFQADGIEGVVPYRRGLGCAVAIGDPVCALRDMPRLADAFRAECLRRGWHTVYAVASEPFATWASERGYARVQFGCEMIVDPTRDPLAGSAAQMLRRRVRRAAREGVVAGEYAPRARRNRHVERAFEAAVSLWREARSGPQLHLVPIDFFAGSECKRYFYARRDEDVVGVMELVELRARGGWILGQLAWTPDAPPGTTEYLAVAAIRTLGEEGCSYATWGPAPLAELGTVSGLGALSEKLGRASFRAIARAFDLESRNRYRRKFPVARALPSYFLFDPPSIGLREALQVLRAFHATPF